MSCRGHGSAGKSSWSSLNLKVDAIYCLQWNQQEKAFDVTLKDEQVYTKVAKELCCCCYAKAASLLQGFNLDRPNFRTITVHMFNPFVTDKALADFFEAVWGSANYSKPCSRTPWGSGQVEGSSRCFLI
ncbi:hypothetical protein KUCAC02_035591 [Chaenocephalus aceratus]|nr:hypothetical protein KUCAC02_035591 [Chaenocephalus aceratus]